MWELARSVDRKARKEHRCSECGKIINKGEVYEDVRGIWEGDWSGHKICQECQDLWKFAEKKYGKIIDMQDIAIGELRETLHEMGYYEEGKDD